MTLAAMVTRATLQCDHNIYTLSFCYVYMDYTKKFSHISETDPYSTISMQGILFEALVLCISLSALKLYENK